MSYTTHWGVLQTRLESYVGFDTIQDQMKKKALKRGFEFNIMVVGKGGIVLVRCISQYIRVKGCISQYIRVLY